MTDRRKGPTGALAVRKHPHQKRTVTVVLVVSLLAGCSPAVHPGYPHARYATIAQCENNARRQNQDPTLCEKHVDLGYTIENAAATAMAIIFVAIVGPLVLIGSALSRDSGEPSSADTGTDGPR